MLLLSHFESSNFALSHLNNWGIHIWSSTFFIGPAFILLQASREYFDEVVCVHTILNCQMIDYSFTIYPRVCSSLQWTFQVSKSIFYLTVLMMSLPLTLSFYVCPRSASLLCIEIGVVDFAVLFRTTLTTWCFALSFIFCMDVLHLQPDW